MTMITTRPAIEVLPPTERAAYHHSLRVHLQVCQWKYLNNHIVDPTEWGWCLQGGSLTPIKTDLEAAPEWLMKYIRCNCKTSSRNTCLTNYCTCRKNGLKCVAACGDCNGEAYHNKRELDFDEIDDDGDFERNVF